jgi:hypothetical protein
MLDARLEGEVPKNRQELSKNNSLPDAWIVELLLGLVRAWTSASKTALDALIYRPRLVKTIGV